MTWIISATQPQPTTLPSITNTSVSKAKCANKISTYGKKYTSSKMRALSSHRAKRLTRLSGLGPLSALAGHDAADQCSQGGQVPRAPALGLAWIRLSEGLSYGTILAEVVTHRLLLLDGSRFPESIDDKATS